MRTSGTDRPAVTTRRVPVRARGVQTPLGALRALPRELGSADCLVEVRVRGRAVPGPADEALRDVARAAVAGAVRRGRASVVVVTVTYAPGGVSVVVRDDGVALAARPGDEAFRLRLGRRALAAAGGGLEISHGRRGGVVVRAWTGLAPG